jgi:putative flippase GtrA
VPAAESTVRTAAALVEQLVRFACVGLTNTVLSYVVYVGVLLAGAPYLVAGAAGFAAGAVNGYLLNRRWTFRVTGSAAQRLRYGAVQGASLAATTLLLWLTVSTAGVARAGAYLFTVPIVTVASFAANRYWVFGGGEGLVSRRPQAGPLDGVRALARR